MARRVLRKSLRRKRLIRFGRWSIPLQAERFGCEKLQVATVLIPGDDSGGKSHNQELGMGRLREYSKHSPDKSFDLCEPFPQSDTLVNGWKRGDLIFHLKIGIRTRLPGRETAEFCADLKYLPPSSRPSSRVGVPDRYCLPREAFGKKVHGLKRPVFVEVVQLRKNDQGVTVPVPLGVSIRLSATDDCAICASNARQARGPFAGTGEASIEVLTRFGDGERDGSPLTFVQHRGRSTTARDDGPGEIVQGAPVVVGNCTEPQGEPGRRRGHMVEREDEPVTLRVVVTPNGMQPLKVLVVDELREVSFEKFGFSYRAAPLQPSAVEQAVHGAEVHTPGLISPNPPRPAEHLQECRPSEGWCAEGCPRYPEIEAALRPPEHPAAKTVAADVRLFGYVLACLYVVVIVVELLR